MPAPSTLSENPRRATSRWFLSSTMAPEIIAGTAGPMLAVFDLDPVRVREVERGGAPPTRTGTRVRPSISPLT